MRPECIELRLNFLCEKAVYDSKSGQGPPIHLLFGTVHSAGARVDNVCSFG